MLFYYIFSPDGKSSLSILVTYSGDKETKVFSTTGGSLPSWNSVKVDLKNGKFTLRLEVTTSPGEGLILLDDISILSGECPGILFIDYNYVTDHLDTI